MRRIKEEGDSVITVSLCMIVKNEERLLKRCLDSVAELADEIVIVDTGSSDRTKEIAAAFTDRIYDFVWTDDFSAARNFAFSKATKDYIYSADADEVLDAENRERFQRLKETLLPEIEIVQMKYANQLQFSTVYNFDEEYRPKLFKRLREFVWEAPIHETVRLAPVVYDSDIVIRHLPESSHAGRDLLHFHRHCEDGWRPPKRLHMMYARELLMAGEKEDFLRAASFFEASAEDVTRDPEEVVQACCIVAHAARLSGDTVRFFKYTAKLLAGEPNSEVCCELGHFYEAAGDFKEAAVWYYNAVYETQPVLNIRAGGDEGLDGLIRCYEKLGCQEQAQIYRKEKERRKTEGEQENAVGE